MGKQLDAQLAFAWHAVETAWVGLLGMGVVMGTGRNVLVSMAAGLGLVALVGFVWSWRHLPGSRTTVETSREKANSDYIR